MGDADDERKPAASQLLPFQQQDAEQGRAVAERDDGRLLGVKRGCQAVGEGDVERGFALKRRLKAKGGRWNGQARELILELAAKSGYGSQSQTLA